MGDSDQATRAVAWSLAAAHTAFFVLVPIILLHALADVGAVLGGLSTYLGAALYLLLWTLAWIAHREVLRQRPGAFAQANPALPKAVGFNAGAFIGAGFVVVSFVVTSLVSGFWLLALFGLVAALVAALLGGLVGLLFALLDAGLLRIAKRIADGYVSAA